MIVQNMLCHMDLSSSSVMEVLNVNLCKEFQSLTDLTGRHTKKADSAELRLPGAAW